MNAPHLHLMVNHVSLFALVIGTVALAVSMKRKAVDLRLFATALFLITGVFGWVAFETGEKAEELIKTLAAGSEAFINEHAMAATWAERSAFLVASLAIATEWSFYKKKKWFKGLQWVLLILAIQGCTVFARTAYLGGQIRHTEVRSN